MAVGILVLCSMIFAIVFAYGIYKIGLEKGEANFYEKLTKGIAPEQVNDSAETLFTARIEICYDEDGLLKEINLVPNSTVPKSV